MNEYFDYDYDETPPERSRVGKIVHYVFKSAITLVILLVLGILFYRMISMGDPKKIKEYVWDASAVDAYNKLENKEEFKIYKYKLGNSNYYNEAESKYENVVVPEFNGRDKDNEKTYGTFRVNYLFYTENTKTLQFTVRYNKVALRNLKEDFELAELPDGECYVFALEDEDGNILKDYSYVEAKKSVYTYRVLLFENVDLSKVKNLTLKIYFIDDVNFTKKAYVSMLIYDSRLKPEKVEISDISTPKLNEGIKEMPAYQTKE